MAEAEVTILVAVYNAEQYLPKCLDSLLQQTLRDIQIVCIDDASTDGSLQLLHQYAARDPRIEVLHLDQNHGQAYARNRGLATARGRYTCFLDADDWYSADAIEQAVSVFRAHPETDCVLFQVDMTHPDRVERYPLPPFVWLTGADAFTKSIDWQIHGVYMVRTALHQRFPYDDTCRWFSDDNTTRLHYLFSREVRLCDGVYHYLQRPSSTSHAVSVNRFDRLKAAESMKRQLTAVGVSQAVIARWEEELMLVLVECYRFYRQEGRRLSVSERRYGLSEMHRVWQAIDRPLLTGPRVRKFGYRPLSFWWLFRLQEWAYFTLRQLRDSIVPPHKPT